MDTQQLLRRGQMVTRFRNIAVDVAEPQAVRDAARDVVRIMERREDEVLESLFLEASDNTRPEARRVAALERLAILLR